MDVLGNNIANVNTVGFRASTTNFTDVFYQTTQGATGPNANTGAAGRNAMQIGLGANVATIAVDLSGNGATNRTDRGMDLMINGDAFFVVRSNGATYFTKSGALDIDADGTLYCTTNGATVLGWGVDENGEIRKDIVDSLKLMTPENQSAKPSPTRNVTLSGNIDSKDKQVAYSVDGTGYPISIQFFDNVGNKYTAKLKVMLANDSTDSQFSVSLTDILDENGSILKRKKLDENGNPTYEKTDQYVMFAGQDLSGYTCDVDGTLHFPNSEALLTFNGSTGEFVSVTGEVPGILNLTLNAGEAAVDDEGNPFPLGGIDIDFSGLTKYKTSGTCSVDPKRGDRNGYNAGNSAGQLNGFSIGTDGRVYAVYDNGDNKLLGQIAVASFPNPSGLEAQGNSLFAATLNSGEFDGVGKDITEIGSFSVGALEMSNVDLATEFTNMITTQRGFQANSRTITTSDTLLEELINLKR